MSVTPARFMITTSLAFMSRQSWAARCTLCALSRAVTDGKDVAMRLSEGLSRRFGPYVICSLSVELKFREGFEVAFRLPRVRQKKTWPSMHIGQPGHGFPSDHYCLMTQTLISGCTSAWRRIGTR